MQSGNSRRARFMVLCLAVLFPGILAAAGVHKWVDKDGKVHYSQAAPKEKPSTESQVRVSRPPSGSDVSEPQPERGENDECLTIKCMADQMEADRLERERGYAQRRAENERAARKKPADGTKMGVGSKSHDTPLDEHLRENCRKGLYYGSTSKVDCNDVAKLRQQWEGYQMQIEAGREAAERRGDYSYGQRRY